VRPRTDVWRLVGRRHEFEESAVLQLSVEPDVARGCHRGGSHPDGLEGGLHINGVSVRDRARDDGVEHLRMLVPAGQRAEPLIRQEVRDARGRS
jgi:hypothetical protein